MQTLKAIEPQVVRRVCHEDLRGYLFEMWREDEHLVPAVKQVYCSAIRPGVIKGWHYHEKQWDYVTCIHGVIQLAVWSDAAAKGDSWVLSQHNLRSVVIPPGWWHGWQNLGRHDALVINCVSELYDRQDPDERRMDPHGINGEIWVRRDG